MKHMKSIITYPYQHLIIIELTEMPHVVLFFLESCFKLSVWKYILQSKLRVSNIAQYLSYVKTPSASSNGIGQNSKIHIKHDQESDKKSYNVNVCHIVRTATSAAFSNFNSSFSDVRNSFLKWRNEFLLFKFRTLF